MSWLDVIITGALEVAFMKIGVSPLQFPCLLRAGNSLIATGRRVIKDHGIQHLGGNLFSYSESVQGAPHLHWLIQPDGTFREFVVIGFDRKWARPLRSLWTFVRVRCEVPPGRPISVGELREKLASLKADGPSPNDEARMDRDLMKFLRSHRDEEMFTPEMFRRFMNEPKGVVVKHYPKL